MNIKLTKKTHGIVKRIKKKLGCSSKSTTINLIMFNSDEFYDKGNVMFKGSDDYVGTIKYHYREWEYVTNLIAKKRGKHSADEFINFYIELFDRGLKQK